MSQRSPALEPRGLEPRQGRVCHLLNLQAEPRPLDSGPRPLSDPARPQGGRDETPSPAESLGLHSAPRTPRPASWPSRLLAGRQASASTGPRPLRVARNSDPPLSEAPRRGLRASSRCVERPRQKPRPRPAPDFGGSDRLYSNSQPRPLPNAGSPAIGRARLPSTPRPGPAPSGRKHSQLGSTRPTELTPRPEAPPPEHRLSVLRPGGLTPS